MHSSLFLRSVHPDEKLVKDVIEKAMEVFKANVVGPHKLVIQLILMRSFNAKSFHFSKDKIFDSFLFLKVP